MKKTDEGQQDLVKTIEAELGHSLSPSLRDAFLHVSRSHFVPRYYKQERPGTWVSHDASAVVYQNMPLITKINAANRPCSSSSQPSIMAAMLEALDLFPGARVLEIGTGTGYNAALVAELVGAQGSVTSIDHDEQLVQIAKSRLQEAGYMQVHVACADGLQCYAPASSFDRIIVTASSSFIPPTWIEQLAPLGIIIGNLLGTLATPLFSLIKQEQGVHGTLLATPAFFMSLLGDAHIYGVFDLSRFADMPVLEVGSTTDFIEMLKDLSLKIFLECQLPGIAMRPHYLGGDPKDWNSFATCLTYADSLATFFPALEAGHTVEVRGEFPLWSRLQHLYEQWQSQGTPSVDRYELSIEPTGRYHISLRTEAVS